MQYFNYKIWLLKNKFEIMTLTELQINTWQSIGHDSAATEKIRNKALEYYIEYRDYLKETNSFIENDTKIQTLLLISYFISEKSEITFDMKGNKINNIAFSINQLVKKHNDYKEFFYHLKQMMRKVTLPAEAKQSEEEINGFMKYFSFVMTFYNKYLTTFDKVNICHNIHAKDLEPIGGEKQYKNKIKYLLWVLYITFRKVFFKNSMDTIGNTCLLSCLFSYFIREIYRQQRITSIYSPEIVQDLGTFPNQFSEIQQIWLSFFCLKDLKTYEDIRNSFMKFMQSLVLKFPEFKQPFSPKNIFMNIKKLQQFYHKNMEMNQIDETLFLKNLISNQENIRFTAFGANRKVAKFHSNNMIQCKKALNYDLQTQNLQKAKFSKNDEKSEQTQNNNYLDVFKRIKYTQTPVILIQATPVNQFATAYNWLYKKSLAYSDQEIGLNLQKLLELQYKNDSYQLGNDYVLEKKKLIEGIFYQLLMEYEEENQENINVASILALEVFYYVMNITNREITEIVETLKVSWFSVWKGIDKLLNFDKTMPNNVKTHLLLLQTSIISSLLWKDTDFMQELSYVDLIESQKDFFFRILHHIAYQINFIGKTINLSQSLMDQSFIVCQYYMKEWVNIMKNMNLDVVVMCSIYGVCKAKSSDIKFKNIMVAYKDVNSIDQKTFEGIQNFELQIGETQQNYNIISFYNKIFVRVCKQILIKIKSETLRNDEKINLSSYVLSPVKSIIPDKLVSRANPLESPKLHQMLFAYNESPLLKKSKKLNIIENPSNKQNIEGQMNNRKKNYNQSQILRQRSNNVSQMIQKKFGKQKSSTLVPKAYLTKQA